MAVLPRMKKLDDALGHFLVQITRRLSVPAFASPKSGTEQAKNHQAERGGFGRGRDWGCDKGVAYPRRIAAPCSSKLVVSTKSGTPGGVKEIWSTA